MNVEEAISHIVAVLRDNYQPEKVILFGLLASGDPETEGGMLCAILRRVGEGSR